MGQFRLGGGSSTPPGTGSLAVPLQVTPARGRTGRAAEPGIPAGLPVLWTWDAATGQITCAARVRAALRLPPSVDLDVAALRRLVHPHDLDRFDDLVLELAGGRGTARASLRVVTPTGAVRALHAWAATRRHDGRLDGAFGGLHDGTDRGAHLGTPRGGPAALHALEQLTGAGLWEWDPGSGELLWTAPMYALLGAEPGSFTPTLHGWQDAVHPQDRQRAARLHADAPPGAAARRETVRVMGVDGRLRHLRCWSLAVAGDGDGGPRVQGAAVEVSGEVRAASRLERLRHTDAVTGLTNRAGFLERLRRSLAGTVEEVGLILLDLDRFTAVNGTLGHQVGDAVLVDVARRLTALLPPGAIAARTGGDEFAVVPLAGLPPAELRSLADGIVAVLRAPYLVPGSAEPLTCPASAGVAAGRRSRVGAEELLAEADLALRRAKEGGARCVAFDDELRTRARARHLAERAVRSALAQDRFVLHYQPVVDLTSNRVVGAEALVRIEQGPDGVPTLLLPDAFIDVAEETGLIVDIDGWVLDEVLDQLAGWRQAATDPDGVPWLAVNVSARSMERPGLAGRLLAGLAERGLPPDLLRVELTERCLLARDPAGESALRELIGAGVPVGIDDFGTGYSALAYLQRFDLAFLKIDRSFVAPVGTRSRADAVVTAIVDLAHAHGMHVTAEGIEDRRQADLLRGMGCDLAQGYHFGRPSRRPVLPVM